MTEHVHDWWPMPIKYGGDAEFYGAECLIEGCDAILMETEVASRLNEYETLKKATERLSAEDAKSLSHDLQVVKAFAPFDDEEQAVFIDTITVALRDYADILEGK